MKQSSKNFLSDEDRFRELEATKEALRVSEERLQLALKSAEIGIWDWDIVTGKIIWSDVEEVLFGYEPGTFPGTYEAYRSRIPDEDFKIMEISLKRALEEKVEHVSEHRVRLPNGTERWLLGRGRAHYNEYGQPIRMAGTSVDITARKKASDVLLLQSKVLDSMAEGVSLVSAQGIILYTNPAENLIFGYHIGELEGKHIKTTLADRDFDFDQKFSQILLHLEKFGTWIGEWSNLRKDGSVFVTHTKISSLKIGVQNCMVCIREDISHQKKAAELSASQAFLEALIENLPNMVFVKDAKELRFVRFNKAGEDLLGYPRNDLIGKNDYDFFPKEQAEFFIQKDRAVLADNKILDIPEESIQTKHKGTRILHTKKIPLFGRDGTPEYLVGISEDVTEYKKMEEQRLGLMREQLARAQADMIAKRAEFLAEASNCLASTLNYQYTLKQLAKLFVPQLADWCTITMVRDDETIERLAAVHHDPAKNILIEELLEKYPADQQDKKNIADVIKTRKSRLTPVITDEVLAGAAKDERHLFLMQQLGSKSCVVVPIKVRDKVFGAIAVMYGDSGRVYHYDEQDMLEEIGRRAAIAIENSKLYEQAQRAIQLRNEFLSIASHELKTPLTSLKLQIQMAKRKVTPELYPSTSPEKLNKMFNMSEKQVNRLVSLIENLLDVSRIEMGKLSYTFETIDLCEIVKQVTDDYSEQLAAEKCHLDLSLLCPVYIVADRFRMEQVVVNLLSNAMKYGNHQPIRISVVQDGNIARLEVQDRGIGIPDAHRERIFDRFERVVANISGLGLGLYISREIVHGHNGTIKVVSELNQGSTFIVELPCK